MNNLIKQINSLINAEPKVCIVLGSGLNDFTKQLKNPQILKYHNISGFLETKVKGHTGQFVYGYINDMPILCAQGRFHYYEGYTFEEVGIIIELFNHYCPDKIIITNSSGCLRLDWEIGDLMLVKQFIDFSFINSNKPEYYKLKNIINDDLGIHKGNYTYTIGPTYETKAEINEIIKQGGDAVGMSTFPEYLMCRKLQIHPIIISCLTNYGAGLINKEVRHEDVLFNANRFKKKFHHTLMKIIQNI